MKTGIFFDCTVCYRRRRFGGSICLHPQSRKIWLLIPCFEEGSRSYSGTLIPV